MVARADGQICGGWEDDREWNDPLRSLSYRFRDGRLSPICHIPGPSGKPLCKATGAGGLNGFWQHVSKKVTCQLCKKRSYL